MLVIARSTLKKYVETRKGRPEYLALKASVDAWYLEADKASWAKMADVKAQFGKSSPSTANQLCSTSERQRLRLIVAIRFDIQVIYIKWIGTHEEYDHIDAAKVKYGD